MKTDELREKYLAFSRPRATAASLAMCSCPLGSECVVHAGGNESVQGSFSRQGETRFHPPRRPARSACAPATSTTSGARRGITRFLRCWGTSPSATISSATRFIGRGNFLTDEKMVRRCRIRQANTSRSTKTTTKRLRHLERRKSVLKPMPRIKYAWTKTKTSGPLQRAKPRPRWRLRTL